MVQMQKQPLFEIATDFLELLNLQTSVNEEGVAETEEFDFLKDTIESKRYDFEEKILNTGKYVKNLEAEISEINGIALAFKERLDKLLGDVKTRENKINRLKKYMKENMQMVGVDKVKSLELNVVIAKNGGKPPVVWSVNDMVERERIVPDDYKKKVINDFAIRRALEDGVELDFAEIGERGTNLRIK